VAEIPDNGLDEDCNGNDTITCIVDADQDGFGTDVGTTTLASDGSCDTGQSESTTSDDCDDTSGAASVTFPGAAQLDSPMGACMKDADDDGYGDDSPAAGGVTAGCDEDDTDAGVHANCP
jgi:hypothetical protein